MADEWGPWIEHDGEGCPPYLINQQIRARLRFTADDVAGHKEGDVAVCEIFVDEAYVFNMPDWWHNCAGTLAHNPLTGEQYSVPYITHFALRRPPAFELLLEIVNHPERHKELEDA